MRRRRRNVAGFSSTGFSLWGLVHERPKPARLQRVQLLRSELQLIEEMEDER
jgi:hypothetical protein